MVRQEDVLASALKLLECCPKIFVRDIKEDLGTGENITVKVRQLAKHNFIRVSFCDKGNVLVIESIESKIEEEGGGIL